MSKKKRNIMIVTVVLCVCAAVYLNWSYNNQEYDESAMADASLSDAKSAEEKPVSSADGYIAEYFAQARLTRQQSRDEAMELLEQATSSETASKETIDGAMNSISAMATYSMQETQIENLILAKGFEDCVAFMSAEGVTLAVPSPAEGLSAENVAKITDTILSETNYTASQLRIIEVKPREAGGGENAAEESVQPQTQEAETSEADPQEAKTPEANPQEADTPESDTNLNDEVTE